MGEVATVDARPLAAWRERLVVAFGGAVVVVVVGLLVMSWSTGLRESSFEQLQTDLQQGSVQQWYAAERLEDGVLGFTQAPMSTVRGDLDEASDGVYLPPEGDPLGGILVWRTWGAQGWRVASESGVSDATGDYQEAATEVSTALVGQLRVAKVPMRPYEFSEGGWLRGAVALGAVAVLVMLLAGPPPRAGNRWFWFWTFGLPLGLGFVAYAVVELIGLRRRPDPPMADRLSGQRGFLTSLVIGIVLTLLMSLGRAGGLPLPF
ncbi:hypothetical protein KLO01_08100 [Knoellia locipacati]|uniref:Uncharacterized protein n=1 Tax=Knoellia locipacati TaxID=882824 RepID=A0A512SXT5_9MICO|nr:hypothetical protein KLO01_08100 [Knoellia locipacati]